MSANKLTLDQLADRMQVPRRYVRDTLVKRADFPRPLTITRKLRFWILTEVDDWLMAQRDRSSGRPRA